MDKIENAEEFDQDMHEDNWQNIQERLIHLKREFDSNFAYFRIKKQKV
jgi:hypothetical protein